MEGQAAGLKPSYRSNLEYTNSKLGQDASNRSAMVLALTHLPIAFNSPGSRGELHELPENRLGEGVYSGGLEGAVRIEGSKWP